MNIEQRLSASCYRVWLPAINKPLRLVFGTLALWYRRLEERRRLADLGDTLIRDSRLSRSQLHKEASKPFWRA